MEFVINIFCILLGGFFCNLNNSCAHMKVAGRRMQDEIDFYDLFTNPAEAKS